MAEDATRRIFISPLGNCCQGPIHRPLLMILKRQKDDFEQQKACEASLGWKYTLFRLLHAQIH